MPDFTTRTTHPRRDGGDARALTMMPDLRSITREIADRLAALDPPVMASGQ
ncbi:hypothetical protein [Nocardia jiangxiensis]|uniref:Uncharacterized protein n=1 Tax=Nocardia jiangxiensis TaxID=282685 RepID=A0ABW6RRG7_9NOCA|nr:hypothetical protein [Nocardia jiangxiensis]